VTNAIIARNGTIDKYMGDAVMAFWNAPLDDAAQETDACNAALDMLEHLDALNQEREREASAANIPFAPILMGIGINTGRCTVGNMGSDLRFQYTVMGDTVNLASRLEGQTRTYDLSNIIGSRTAAAVADEFALLEIDTVRVEGERPNRGHLHHSRARGFEPDSGVSRRCGKPGKTCACATASRTGPARGKCCTHAVPAPTGCKWQAA